MENMFWIGISCVGLAALMSVVAADQRDEILYPYYADKKIYLHERINEVCELMV